MDSYLLIVIACIIINARGVVRYFSCLIWILVLESELAEF